MLLICKCFREYIGHIFNCVYIEVVDNSSMQISTVVIVNVDVCSSSVDNSRGDKGESILIVEVDWQRL